MYLRLTTDELIWLERSLAFFGYAPGALTDAQVMALHSKVQRERRKRFPGNYYEAAVSDCKKQGGEMHDKSSDSVDGGGSNHSGNKDWYPEVGD